MYHLNVSERGRWCENVYAVELLNWQIIYWQADETNMWYLVIARARQRLFVDQSTITRFIYILVKLRMNVTERQIAWVTVCAHTSLCNASHFPNNDISSGYSGQYVQILNEGDHIRNLWKKPKASRFYEPRISYLPVC